MHSLQQLHGNLPFFLPQGGNNRIFVEITYKNDIPFTVGMYHNNINFEEVGGEVYYNPRSEWNTVYIDVNDEVRAIPGNEQFTLFLRANGGGDIGEIRFDNIRVVHFK